MDHYCNFETGRTFGYLQKSRAVFCTRTVVGPERSSWTTAPVRTDGEGPDPDGWSQSHPNVPTWIAWGHPGDIQYKKRGVRAPVVTTGAIGVTGRLK